MRTAIVGAGAIGCLLGMRLHESGQSVLLVHHRRETAGYIKDHGVTLRKLSGETINAHLNVKQSLSRQDNADLVILSVKSYDTEAAVRQLAKVLPVGVPLLSLQNGLGNLETILRFVPKHSLIGGTTTEGAFLRKPGSVVHTGEGTTWLGEIDGGHIGRLNAIKNLLQGAGFKVDLSKNILGAIWSKAIVNSAINPISAIARVSNRELLTNPNLIEAALAIIREGIEFANERSIALAPSPVPLLFRVLKESGANRSSMFQDIESGRTTEIRQLNGWIASHGKRSRLETPYNVLVTRLVLGLERTHKVSHSQPQLT